MAIVVSTLVGEAVYAGAQSRTTAANVTIGANELGLCVLVNKKDGGSPPPGAISSITHTGANWEIVDATKGTVLYNSIATSNSRITLFRCMPTSAVDATATINVDSTSQAVWNYYFLKATGVTTGANGANAILQAESNRADSPVTSLTVTLATLGDALNAVVGFFGGSNDNTSTPEAGYTELVDQTANNGDSLAVFWDVGGDTTPTNTYGGNNAAGGIAIELQDASLAGGADPEGSLIGGKLIRGGLLMHGVLGR